MNDDDAQQGDTPDTFDGRLAGIARLIDTFDADTDPARRAQRRATIVRLADALAVEAVERVNAELDRLGER